MRKGKTVIYIVLWIAVLAVLSLFMKPAKITSCAAQQGNILVTGRSGYELPIIYEEVTAIEYRGELDYGALIDGVDDGKEKSGQWENAELGQYLLCVNAKVNPCIILRTREQTMVINYESQQSTQALYDALLEQIDPASHPYPGSSETLSTEGQMLAVTTRGFVDVDGVKLSAIQIQYNIDLTGAEIDKDTYSLEVYHGTVLENFGGGDIGDITGITISGDTVTLSIYADYHLSSETPFNCDVETPFGWWLGNDPDGYSNHSMTVLRCDDDSGELKGILVSFGMKPSAIDNAGRKENQRQISSEICGAFCNKMETAFGVPVIYAVSAGGNQVPCKSAFRHQVNAQGEVLEIDEGVTQGLAYADELSDEMYAACAGIVKEIRCQESVLDGKWSGCSMPWTRRRGGPRKLTRKVTHTAEGETAITADLFQMGATTFVMVCPEMTAECERLLRAENPNHRVILMTLTNGEMKCLPDQSSFEKGTYEAQGSNLMPGAAEVLIGIVSEKIRDMTQ